MSAILPMVLLGYQNNSNFVMFDRIFIPYKETDAKKGIDWPKNMCFIKKSTIFTQSL